MSDETRNGGPPDGPRVPASEDELRRDESRWIARGHYDAAELYALLQGRHKTVAQLVEDFGPGDCRRARVALQRFTEFSHRLLATPFADLDES